MPPMGNVQLNQRRLKELPACCREAVYHDLALGDPLLQAGHECPTCAALWRSVAPGHYVMLVDAPGR